MTIAPYRESELDAVVALWEACGLNRPPNDPAQDIAFLCAAPHAELFLDRRDGRVIGTVMVGHDGHRGWLYRLAVAPDRRGRGHGRALVAHAEAWLAARGVRKANLMIVDANLAVRDFYARLGYAEQPRTVMGKWLAPAGGAAGSDAVDGPADARPARRMLDVVVTFLEMTEPPRRPPVPAPPGKLALLRAEDPPVAFYRFLYDTVGEPWFWVDRRLLDDESLAAVIGDPRVEIYVLYEAGVPAGFVELDRRPTPDIAIAYFGLMPRFIGRGFGPYLLHWTVERAWAERPRRLTVETCTLDHPKALALYQRAGFRPYDQAAKRIDDPRLSGLIPPHRQPRLP